MDTLQWPAMILTLLSVWWIGSNSARQRRFGLWCSLLGNAVWIAWGFHDRAWAVIVMQFSLGGLNVRGALKNARKE